MIPPPPDSNEPRRVDPDPLSNEQLRSSLKEIGDLKAALDGHAIVAITDPKGRIAITDPRGRITFANDKFAGAA